MKTTPKPFAIRSRVVAILLIAFVIGTLIGQVAWCIAFASLGLCLHGLWNASRLIEWMNGGRKPPLSHSGVWAQIHSNLRREQRANKERHRKTLDTLRRYSESANALPDAALILDKDNNIIGSNAAARHTLGVNHKRDRGQRVDNLLRDPLIYSLLNNELAEPEIQIPSPVNEGDTLLVRITEYGANTRLFLAQDISEQLRNKDMRQAFVANVSHELLTPLTVVNGHVEMLLDDPDINEEQLAQLLQVAKHSNRMQDLVQDLLALARLESAPPLAAGRPVDMAELIEDETESIHAADRFPEHTLEFSIDKSLVVSGKRSEIQSVAHNLILNALRHTPAGTHVQVTWAKSPNGRPVLSVADNGPGIPEEYIPHLTDRFYRAETGRDSNQAGTGLGLSIVKHALQRHGGELRIDSSVNSGTSFEAFFNAERALDRSSLEPLV